MPFEVRGFIKTSFACLLAGAILGTLHFGWGAVLEGAPPPWLRPLHLHLVTVGWLLNMVFGMALWMFPMPKGATRELRPRYPRAGAWTCYGALNLGLALRFVAEPLGQAAIGLVSGILQAGGIVAAAVILWPRIRAITVPPSNPPPAGRGREGR